MTDIKTIETSPIVKSEPTKINPEYLWKVCVLGDIGTGKTSFIKRVVHNIFSIHYKSTIGVDFALEVLKNENDTCRFQLWDIAGQERYGNMTRVYYKESVGAFVIIDATRPATLEGAIKWKRDFDAKCGWEDSYPDNSPSPVILLINKIDLLDSEALSELNYDGFCKEHGFHSWLSICAKDATNTSNAIKKMYNICMTSLSKPTIKTEVESKIESKIESKEIKKAIEVDNELPKDITDAHSLVNDVIMDLYNTFERNRGQNDDYVIRTMKTTYFELYFNKSPKALEFRKAMKDNYDVFMPLSEIHDILLDSNMEDTVKIVNIVKCILDYGKSQL